jgi:shikimate dehydrogenase
LTPTGATHVAAVVGDPVRHSLSPAIHNAAFAALGLDWSYVAFTVPAGNGAAAAEAMRTLGLSGLSVTMPLKAEMAAAVDRVTAAAGALGAVNTVSWSGRELLGSNTDGAGFLDALRVDEGFDPAGCRAVVVGAGGAARAVVVALADAGAREVVVVNRSSERAEHAVALAPKSARIGVEDEIDGADVIVNATPIGMRGATVTTLDGQPARVTMPFDPVRVGRGQIVVDLIYHPPVTELLDAVRQRGAVAVGGLGMLIHQAAHQLRLWTGEDPPLEVMSAAALRQLSR